MKKYEETDGVWRTVRGRRIFIRKGEDLSSAMKRSGKFEKIKREDVVKGRLDEKKDELREKAQKNVNQARKNYEKARGENNQDKRKKYMEKFNKEATKFEKRTNKIKELDKTQKEYDNSKETNDFKNIKGKHVDKKQVENAKYNETKQDVLEYFGEDFGYEDTTPEKAFVDQIDYMKNPNESIHDTAKRFAEGGGMLVYNQDMAEYLNKKGIKATEDDAFDKYTEYMATNMEKMYNEYKNEKVDKINAFKEKKQSNNAPKINKTLEKKGKVNQKTLKSYADDGMATDITRFSDKDIDNLEKKHGRLTHVKTSMGTYGMNGALLKSEKTGEYFVITSRNSTLFRLV